MRSRSPLSSTRAKAWAGSCRLARRSRPSRSPSTSRPTRSAARPRARRSTSPTASARSPYSRWTPSRRVAAPGRPAGSTPSAVIGYDPRPKRGKGMRATRGSRTAVVVARLLLAAVALPWGQAALAANPWGASYFPNVPLITQDGTPVRFYDDLLKGKAVAINLIYTSCKDECPLETARLVQVQRLLGDHVGKDIFFYSISIDPKRDTPAVLKAYAEKLVI